MIHVLSVWRDVELVGYLVAGVDEVPYPPTERGLQRAVLHALELSGKLYSPEAPPPPPQRKSKAPVRSGQGASLKPARSRARSRSLWTDTYGDKP